MLRAPCADFATPCCIASFAKRVAERLFGEWMAVLSANEGKITAWASL